MAPREAVARRRDLERDLDEVDVLYLDEVEADDLRALRALDFRPGGLSDEERERASELVAVYRRRFAEDVRTIGPTLTREEVERLFSADHWRDETPDEHRRAMVAFELAVRRGGNGVNPRNVPRVLWAPVVTTTRRPVHRSEARTPRARRTRRARSTRSRARRSGADDGDPEPDLEALIRREVVAAFERVLGGAA